MMPRLFLCSIHAIPGRPDHIPLRILVALIIRMDGVVQSELADESGVHATSISRWLCGHAEMRDQNIDAILEALGGWERVARAIAEAETLRAAGVLDQLYREMLG